MLGKRHVGGGSEVSPVVPGLAIVGVCCASCGDFRILPKTVCPLGHFRLERGPGAFVNHPGGLFVIFDVAESKTFPVDNAVGLPGNSERKIVIS